MFNTEILSFDDRLFKLVRKFPAHPEFPIEEAKQVYFCDTVLKKDGMLYLCREIKDAVIIQDDEQVQLVEEGTQESEAKERTKGEVKAATTD
jgi:hypothetical protein